MATFSQFTSKYIIERRSKNVGDEGTKNIVKKLLGRDAIPDDGGKSGQSRIEKELGLNKSNKSSTKNRFFTDKPDSETLKTKPTGDEGQFKQQPKKFSSGARGTTPSGSPEMGGESKKFVKNRRTPLKTKVIQPNTNRVRKPFEPSFEIKGTTKKTSPPSKPTFTKTNNPSFKDFSKKANVNVNSKKPVSFDITTNKGNVVTQSRSSAVPSGGIKTDLLDLVNKPKTNPVSKFVRKGLEVQGIVDKKPNTKSFTRTTDTITRNIGKVKPSKLGRLVRGAGRIIAPAYAIKDYLDTAAKTKAQGYSKNYSRAKGITKALSGYIGGGIGATIGGGVGLGIPGSIAGGVTGYHYGSKLGDKAFDYGQKVVSGKKTFKDIRKDVNKGIRKLDFRNKQY